MHLSTRFPFFHVQVDGHNLQYVRTVQASLSAGPGPAISLPTKVLQVLHEEQAASSDQPLTLLQSTWHQVRGRGASSWSSKLLHSTQLLLLAPLIVHYLLLITHYSLLITH